MEEGKVKFFYESKGYGFIEHNDGREVYFHYTALREKNINEINSGDKVNFDLLTTISGLEASNVVVG